MFKKLEREITVHNAVILIVSLIIFCMSVYVFTKGAIDRAIDKLIKKRIEIYRDVDTSRYYNNSGKHAGRSPKPSVKSEKTDSFDFRIRFDSIIYDDNKEIMYESRLQSEENLDVFKKLLEDEGNINQEEVVKVVAGNREYRVYTGHIKGEREIYIQLIHDYEVNKAFLNKLLIMFLTVGGVSIAALILISKQFAKRALIPIEESWKQQKNFVADASHELRTPLAVLQINLEAAMSDKKGTIEENEIWLENAMGEVKKMGELVNELLMLARIDAKEIEIKDDVINLSLLSQEISQQMEILFESSNITFNKEIDDQLYIKGDEAKIRQLIVILLDNAVKYNKLGGEIYFNLEKEDKLISLSIRDTGIGIDEKDLKHIFDRFYMVDKSRSREKGGSGLGLSIAKWIVEIHRGKIYVESVKGKGSIFTVKIPIVL
ncbi:ATP-binding protein [Wukongibacter baidiensis]|uniref:sensor histidine kinase n=1 Tax=Wukongibacter baidiensis TaxID=1723361 RepID=UPI003D7F7E45